MWVQAPPIRSEPPLTSHARLVLADAGEAADLAAFLVRLLRFDRAAAVRLQAVAGGPAGGPQGA